jgi:hypothetical protein
MLLAPTVAISPLKEGHAVSRRIESVRRTLLDPLGDPLGSLTAEIEQSESKSWVAWTLIYIPSSPEKFTTV